MKTLPYRHDRRAFLRLAGMVSIGATLAGCGVEGGDAASSEGIVVVPADGATPVKAEAVALGEPLNLALALAYLGAQFHSHAATGAGLPTSATQGVGAAGEVGGARQVAFADPLVARSVADIAAAKVAHVTALRDLLGPQAAAQATLDLSEAPFRSVAERAGLGTNSAIAQPYADDRGFLAAAFLVESRVAATYRTLLDEVTGDAARALLTAQLGDSIYHGGLIRALLDDRAATDPALAAEVAKVGALLASIDASDRAATADADIADAGGRPIAYRRDDRQTLQSIYLARSGTGGFAPDGINGVVA